MDTSIYSGLMVEDASIQELLASLGDIAANTRYPPDSLIAQKILMKWSEILDLSNRDIETLMVPTSTVLDCSGNITSLPDSIARGLVYLHIYKVMLELQLLLMFKAQTGSGSSKA